MEDKGKLMVATMGAISAYIRMEQQPPSVAPESSPTEKLIGWQISQRAGVNERIANTIDKERSS